MQPLLDLILASSLQLLVAAAAAALGAARTRRGARRTVGPARAARTLRRAVPAALVGVFAAWLVGRLTVGPPAFEPVTMFLPGLATLALAPATGGGWLVVAAGRDERRGRLARARRGVALGGHAMFLGTAAAVTLWGAAYIALPAEAQRALVASGALAGQAGLGGVVLGLGGFIGLLAGLTGKPRPSGAFAVALHLAGLWLLFSAARAIGGYC